MSRHVHNRCSDGYCFILPGASLNYFQCISMPLTPRDLRFCHFLIQCSTLNKVSVGLPVKLNIWFDLNAGKDQLCLKAGVNLLKGWSYTFIRQIHSG